MLAFNVCKIKKIQTLVFQSPKFIYLLVFVLDFHTVFSDIELDKCNVQVCGLRFSLRSFSSLKRGIFRHIWYNIQIGS